MYYYEKVLIEDEENPSQKKKTFQVLFQDAEGKKHPHGTPFESWKLAAKEVAIMNGGESPDHLSIVLPSSYTEGYLKNGLDKSIVRSVSNELYKRFGEDIERKINDKAKELFESKVDQLFSEKLIEIYDNYLQSDEAIFSGMNLSDYTKHLIQQSTGGGSRYQNKLKSSAEKIGDEIKSRYDMQFAAHVVNNLAKNGMLKDDAIAKLLK